MKKIFVFYLMILLSFFVFSVDSVIIVLPRGQFFVGTDATFTIQSPDSTLVYKWTFDDGSPEKIGQSVTHTFKEPKTYKIKCSVQNTSGETLSAEENFTVGDNRRVQIRQGAFIAGTEVNIEAINFAGNKVKWDFGDGNIKQNGQQNTKHTYQNPGSFTVKAFDYNGTSNTAITAAVTIIADNRSISYNPATAISTQEISFEANNFTTNNLKWDFGDGAVQNGSKNKKHSYQNAGNYTVKAYDATKSPESGVSNTITINPDNRAISFSIISPFVGQTVSFTASNFSSNNLKWDFGNGIKNGGKTITQKYTSPGNYTVKVSDLSIASLPEVTKNITINPDNRAISFSIISPFVGQTVSFTASNFSSNNLKWDFGNGIKNGGNRINQKYTSPGNYTVKVSDLSIASLPEVTKTITINPDNRTISFSIISPFVGQTVSFTASNFSSNNLKWNFGNGIKNGGNRINQKYTSPGNYTVKVSDLSIASLPEVTKNITIKPDNRSISINNNNPSLYQPITFTANNFTSPNIEWDFGDGKKQNGNQKTSHFYSRRGQFRVKVKEIGSDRPVVEKRISVNADIRQIEISPYRINVGDFANLKLKNSTVNTVDWKIGRETKRNMPSTFRYQFIDPGNFEITCIVNGQTPIMKRITVNDTRKVIVKMRHLFEGTNIDFEAINFKGHGLKWDYGDGMIKNDRNKVKHQYRRAGNYTLKVYDFNGKSKVPILYNIRIVPDNRKVSSEYENTYTGTPAEFKAKDFIENNVKWDFGDGTIIMSNSKAKHIYKSPGVYIVKAVDMGGRGLKNIIKKVIVKTDNRKLSLPQKIIAGVPAKLGLKGYLSGDYEWKFDDGSIARGNSLLSKIFGNAGMVKVTLIDRSKKNPPMIKHIKIVPDMRLIKLSDKAVLPKSKVVFTAVQFLGKEVQWDFGDGTIKTTSAKSISHTYSKLGKFRVIASDFGGKGKKQFQKEVLVSDILPGFRIEAIEFKFNDGKYYNIAQKNQYKLDYKLRIRAKGSGILNGKIIVDGVTLGLFEIYMKGNDVGYLKKSVKPKLPLIELGMHKLYFEFTNFEFSGKKPVLRYFVTIGKSILLKTPRDNSVLSSLKPVKFIWTKPYKNLDYEYSFSSIPFQFLNDDQIKWVRSKTKNSFIMDFKNNKKTKYGYLILRAKDSNDFVKTISQIYSFKIK